MRQLKFDIPLDAPFRILCLGAHSDDIEIGCGGFLQRLLAERPLVSCHWVVLGANSDRRAEEARVSAEAMLVPATNHSPAIGA